MEQLMLMMRRNDANMSVASCGIVACEYSMSLCVDSVPISLDPEEKTKISVVSVFKRKVMQDSS